MKAFFLILLSINLFADHTAITHAPIGVMGDHTHLKGETMFSLRYMRMQMKGIRKGNDSITDSDYPQIVKPQEMVMNMAMLGAMYGISDQVTLMGMVNYSQKSMNLKNAMSGMNFETSSKSLNDSSLSLLYKFVGTKSHHGGGIVKFGVGVPTGSLNNKDEIPMMGETQLPHSMQNGSGTWDPSIGFVYQNYLMNSSLNLGIDTNYQFRLGNNDNGYQLGDNLTLNLWAAYKLAHWISLSIRGNFQYSDKMNGADSQLMINGMMNPLANVISNTGGTWTNIFLGSNLMLGGKHRLAIELSMPVAQNPNGLQMDKKLQIIAGWQYLL